MSRDPTYDLLRSYIQSYVRPPHGDHNYSRYTFTTPLYRLRTWIVMCGRDTYNPTSLHTYLRLKSPATWRTIATYFYWRTEPLLTAPLLYVVRRYLQLYLQTYDKTATVPQLISTYPQLYYSTTTYSRPTLQIAYTPPS